MDNFLLFVFGLAVTLISGMGVLVYMASLGYDKRKTRPPETDAGNDAISGARTVSAPGAVLEVRAIPIPPGIQDRMAKAIRKE